MPILRLSDSTIRLARRAGLPLVRIGGMEADRTWAVPISDDVAQLVELWRIRGEHDDAALSRLILDTEMRASGQRY